MSNDGALFGRQDPGECICEWVLSRSPRVCIVSAKSGRAWGRQGVPTGPGDWIAAK